MDKAEDAQKRRTTLAASTGGTFRTPEESRTAVRTAAAAARRGPAAASRSAPESAEQSAGAQKYKTDVHTSYGVVLLSDLCCLELASSMDQLLLGFSKLRIGTTLQISTDAPPFERVLVSGTG